MLVIHFDIDNLTEKIKQLEKETTIDGFWDDKANSTAILSKLKQYQNKFEKYNKLKNEIQNLIDLNELLEIEGDPELVKDQLNYTSLLKKEVDLLEIESLFSGKYDKNNAILTIHPGARRYRITRLGSNAL